MRNGGGDLVSKNNPGGEVLNNCATGEWEYLSINIWRIRYVAWPIRSDLTNHGTDSLEVQIADKHYLLYGRMSTSVSTFELLSHQWIPISSTHVLEYLPADFFI